MAVGRGRDGHRHRCDAGPRDRAHAGELDRRRNRGRRTCRSTAATSSTSRCSTPGVTRDVRTGDISFAGQRGTLNSLVVDGADNNNTFFGQTAGPHRLGPRAVSVQPGRGAGVPGQLERLLGRVRPRRRRGHQRRDQVGHQRLHGSAVRVLPRQGAQREQLRSTSCNNRPKSPYHYNQFGGTLGGPIRRDRDFFFVNYDGQRNTTPNTVVLNLPANPPTDPASLAGIAESAAAGARAGNARLRPGRLPDQDRSRARARPPPLAALQPSELHRRGLRERRPHQRARAHRRRRSCGRARSTPSFTSVVSAAALQRGCAFQYARDQEPGVANSDDPEAVVQQSGTHGAHDRPQHLQPARDDDQALAGRRHADLAARRAQAQGRLRLPVRRHPQLLPRASSAAPTRSAASPSFAGGRPNGAERVLSAELSPARARPAPITHPEHPASTRSSCRTSGSRAPTSR